MAVDADVYRRPTPGWQDNRRNAKAVSTPGAVNAWEAMSRRFGSLPWRELFAPAIVAARDGFALDERSARWATRSGCAAASATRTPCRSTARFPSR